MSNSASKSSSHSPIPADQDYSLLDRQQQQTYRSEYKAEYYEKSRLADDEAFSKIHAAKSTMLRKWYTGGAVLDVCCGSGEFLIPMAEHVDEAIGIDFSPEIIEAAKQKTIATGHPEVTFLQANARELPFENGRFSLLFSFSSLYSIPGQDQILKELARVLKPGGIAILDMGVSHSLNALVAKRYDNLATPFYMPLRELYRIADEAGFELIEDRAFQLLPMWGKKPKWMRPLLHPAWLKIMALPVGNSFLDEVLSNVWPLKYFAFRHILICRKRAA